MAWSQDELNWFSNVTGQTITPEMALGAVNPVLQGQYSDPNYGLGNYNIDPNNPSYYSNTGQIVGFNPDGTPIRKYNLIDPKTGQPIVRMEDRYGQGIGDVLDPSQVKYDPYLGVYTPGANFRDTSSWLDNYGYLLPFLAIGGAAAIGGVGAGATGATASMGEGATAATAAEGATAAGTGGALTGAEMGTTYPLTSTGLAEGAAAPTGTALTSGEVAAGTAGAGAVGSSAGSAGGGLFGTGITGQQALQGAGLLNSVLGGGQGSPNYGQMLTSLGNAYYQNQLADQGVDQATELAKNIKFTPYAISSPLGRTYQDPVTGEMKSEFSPEAGMMNQELMNQFMGNMQYATMDPMEASQYAYNMGSNLNAYQDEQNRLGLENRLLAQGMLGSTGGGTQMRSLYDAMNQRDLGREAQSLGLGQQMLSQYQQRGLNAYQPMLQTQAALANQLGQSGQFGNYAQQGQFAGANLINNANLAKIKFQSGTATGFANNPILQNGISNLANGIWNWATGPSNTGYSSGSFTGSGLGGNTGDNWATNAGQADTNWYNNGSYVQGNDAYYWDI